MPKTTQSLTRRGAGAQGKPRFFWIQSPHVVCWYPCRAAISTGFPWLRSPHPCAKRCPGRRRGWAGFACLGPDRVGQDGCLWSFHRTRIAGRRGTPATARCAACHRRRTDARIGLAGEGGTHLALRPRRRAHCVWRWRHGPDCRKAPIARRRTYHCRHARPALRPSGTRQSEARCAARCGAG